MTKRLKRMTSWVLAMVMIVGLSALATGAPKVTSIDNGVFVATLGYSEGAYQPGAVVSQVSKDYGPGDTINIYLNPAKFSGTDVSFTPDKGMSTRDLESAGVQLRTSRGKNSNLIQSVSFQEQTLNGKPVAYIQVKLVSNFTETSSRDFEVTLSLYANKNKAQSIVVGGRISNTTKEVDAGDDYIFLGDGSVVTALDNIQRIEVDTGNNISIFLRMFKDRQYYAVSSINPTRQEDIDLMNKHPEMQMIVQMDTRGFDSGNPEVQMRLGETLHAYDADGKYLGTTDKMLAFSQKYYLASEQIEFVPTDPGTGSQEGGDTSGPADDGTLPGDGSGGAPSEEPGGGHVVGGGDSDIPDTGINTGLKVAVGAGVVSVAALVVIGISSRKKKDENSGDSL